MLIASSLPLVDLYLCVFCAVLACLDLCWLLCHVLLQPFLSLNISFSCFLALLVRCRSRSCGLGLHMHAQAYIKGFGSFPSHVHIFLLISMLYLHVCLSRSRLYHALCLLWACACVVASVPPRACLDVTTCEINPRGVGAHDSHLSPLHVMLICLPCLLYATCLAYFASLHICTLAYMFMHESMCRPYSNPMELWTLNPNLHLSSQDHTHSKTKPQSPKNLKPRKLMPIACFQLSMSENYDFTITKDCLWASIVGCLTSSPHPHETKILNSRIKIFYPSTLDQEKNPFSQPRINNKIKQSQVTNHTLEKTQWLAATSLTLSNILKIDSYSNHTPEV